MSTQPDSFRKRSGGGFARSLSKKATVAVAAMAMFAPFVVSGTAAYAAPEDNFDIRLNAADVEAAATNRNGLTFKGFGILTGNSTSSVLMDYKAEHPDKYWELINVLYGGDHPILNTVKIEMGNDRNTSTGPNAATMRSADEYPNVQREPGFQLAADAKKVAKDPSQVHVSLLSWELPTWVGSWWNADAQKRQYKWYKNTILAAYRQYGYMVDSLNPDKNETGNPDEDNLKQWAGWIKNDTAGFDSSDVNKGFKDETEQKLFNAIKIVGGDTVGTPGNNFGPNLTSDKALQEAVDIAGFHYSSADDGAGSFKKVAEQLDKEVWNSEGQATFSNTADRPNNSMNSTSGSGNGSEGNSGTGLGGTNSALEMANWVTTGFKASRRTMTILQPAIGSFYDGFQYSAKEVVSARDPWSGWIYYDGGLAALEHFTNFAKLGWENGEGVTDKGIWRGIANASDSTLGQGNPPSGARDGKRSFTTLAAPDKSDFSTVAVNDSKYVKNYTIHLDKAMYDALGEDKTIELWETKAAESGAYDSNYVKPISEGTFEKINDNDYAYHFTMSPWSMVTATSLDNATNTDGKLTPKGEKGSADYTGNKVPTSAEYTDVATASEGAREVLDTDATGKNRNTEDGYLYADDFDYKEEGNLKTWENGKVVDSSESYIAGRGGYKPAGTASTNANNGITPRYNDDTNGAFESVATDDPTHGRVLRQQIGQGMAGGAWNGGDPLTTIGDLRWANYKVSTDVLFEDGSGRYATLGARQQGGNSNGIGTSAAEIRVDTNGAWSLRRYGSTVASGQASDVEGVNWKAGSNQWNNIAVQVAGNVYTAYLNGVQVATYTDANPEAAGRIQIGSSYNFTQFDNLKVETVEGYTPYYTDIIDGMHQTSWSDVTAKKLTYNDQWQHLNGRGMFEYQRTSSTSTGQGATLEYTFEGVGLDIAGNNSGSAKLNVYVDGQKIAANAPTYSNGNMRTNFQLRGLEYGTHTVKLETANDSSLNVDYVGAIKKVPVKATVDTKALKEAVDSYKSLNKDDWNAETWAVFQANLDAAKAAVADPAAYGLDTEGAAALLARLADARKNLVDKYISPETKQLGLISAVAKGSELPKTVKVDGKDAAITWDEGAAEVVANAGAYTQATITGVTDEKIDGTYRYRVSATVEVLPSLNIEYFIDSGVTGDQTSPEYAAVKAAIPGLRNQAADQKAGDWGYGANAVVKGGADLNNKYATGLYQNGNTLTYTLPLEAGSYNLVAGFTEWWGGENRPMKLQASWTEDGETKTVDGSQIASIGTAGKTADGSVAFTLKADTTVTFSVLSNGGKDPVISWLAVEKQPTNLGVVAATTGDSLPKTVSYDGADVPVTWNTDAVAAFAAAEPYKTLTLAGQATVNGKAQTVTATVEPIPAGLTYYIDSGTNGTDSPQYLAVKNAVPGLRNDKVDQVSDAEDTWGYVADQMKVKSNTDINDKYSTGLYQDSTKLIYRLPLEAGTYTLTGGFAEWWNQDRSMYQTVNADGKELAKSTVSLSGSNTPLTESLTFTLNKAATVDYVVTNEGAGGQKPVISWVAVAAKQVADTTTLKLAVAAAEQYEEADYTAESWAAFAAALAEAKDVLANEDATQKEVNDAAAKLLDAASKLVKAEKPAPTVNKAVLNALIEGASKLNEKDYTAESWEPFSKALDAAKKAAANDSATQDDVDDAAIALVEAQAGLVAVTPEPEPTPVDKTLLNKVIDAAKGVDLSAYTKESADAFSKALTDAEKVAADDSATQEDVNDAIEALVKAQAGLTVKPAPEPEPADRTVLDAAVAAADKLAEADYTAASWKPFAKALAAAKAVPADADQATVNAAAAALVKAQAALVKRLKIDGLKAAVESASKANEKDYTPESWQPFADALDAAKAVLARAEAFNGADAKTRAAAPTQTDVDNAVKALVEAQAALAPVKGEPEPEPEPTPSTVDKTALKAVVDAAAKLNEKDYTAESWKPFAEALTAAKAVLANDKATQQDVTNAVSALFDAVAGLTKPAATPEPTPADKTLLQALVDSAAAAQEKDYTADSWKAFAAALAAAKAVLADANATQQQIADAGKALFQTYGALAKPETNVPTEPGNGDQNDTDKGEDDAGDTDNGGNTVTGDETVDTTGKDDQSDQADQSGDKASDADKAADKQQSGSTPQTGVAVAGVAALALIAAACGVVLTLARRRRD